MSAPSTAERTDRYPATIPILLRAEPFTAVAPNSCNDFQSRVGRPTVTDQDGATPCVVVFTRAVDREIDRLSLWLAAQGIPLLRIDSDRCPGAGMVWDPAVEILHWESHRFRPRVCWQRYFTTESMPVPDDALLAHYGREQWPVFASALFGGAARAVNAAIRPGHPDRVSQLTAARAVGLSTPATVVATTLADTAAAIPGGGDLLVKSLGRHAIEPQPGSLRGVFPRRMSRALIAEECGVEPAPVLVQEFVPASSELRVYAVGQRLIGYRITRTSPDAMWTDPASIRVEPVVLPARLEAALAELTTLFGLDVAAYDLLDTEDGPVFLEVNTACDWLWAEAGAGSETISVAVRELVAGLYSAYQGAGRG
ncbi:RimK family alpha-L-glutamate ligase [Nocardia sp. NPDC051052]|uniref:RimK family alpha-L-glutamate ligase n=1 Tax=Nocardia sp. NPDC051052 TaxID=3364322 RepID=UPI0037A65329